MAVPFRRTSKTKKRMRRTHLKKTAEVTTKCSNCGSIIKTHRACTACGFYKGKDVVNKVVEEKAEVKENKKVKKEAKEIKK